MFYFMKKLPNEVIDKIVSKLDDYQKISFSLTCKEYKKKYFNKSISLDCQSMINNLKLLKSYNHKIIKRIGTEGVVYGECEDCRSNGLLYEAFRPTYEDEKKIMCICLEHCRYYCYMCDNYFKAHYVNDCHEPHIMCDECRRTFNFLLFHH
jgi:hypothetical protein